MNTHFNTWNANEACELSTDELSVVSGGNGQCGNNGGPSWGQISTAAVLATTAVSNITIGAAGAIATLATCGAINAVKQVRE